MVLVLLAASEYLGTYVLFSAPLVNPTRTHQKFMRPLIVFCVLVRQEYTQHRFSFFAGRSSLIDYCWATRDRKNCF